MARITDLYRSFRVRFGRSFSAGCQRRQRDLGGVLGRGGMTYSIHAEGLVKRYGDTVALDGIDLAVRTGSLFGLLGPNDAGKTTAVRILATLVRPDGGHAAVCGHDVVSYAHQVRQPPGLPAPPRRRRGGAARLGRHAQAAGPSRQPGHPAAGALPGRADDRARPAQPSTTARSSRPGRPIRTG